MALEFKDLLTTGIGIIGIGQTLFIFNRGRKDKLLAERRIGDKDKVDGISAKADTIDHDLKAHIKEDREMHERLQKAETRIEGMQQQINDVNSRHGDLVSRIDEIHNKMLTKDDLKMLVDFLRK